MRACIVPALVLWVSGCGLVLDVDPQGSLTEDGGGRDGASDASFDSRPGTCTGDDQCGDCTFCVDGLCVPAPVGSACPGGTCDLTGVCTNECIEGAPCETGNVCEIGRWECDDTGRGTCTARGPAAPGTECRPAAGLCDMAEFCDGEGVACPGDQVRGADEVCRGAAADQPCDLPEVCDGSGPFCPDDGETATPGTECGMGLYCDAAGACAGCPEGDECTPEGTCQTHRIVCLGGSPDCQRTPDPVPSGTVCRPLRTGGVCDVAEVCDGTGLDCPEDEFALAGTLCRAAAGPCQDDALCRGDSPTCPINRLRGPGYECGPPAGPCDVPETCGTSTDACPADELRPAGTVCGPPTALLACDLRDTCDGVSAVCRDQVRPAGTPCGALAGLPPATACQLDASCDGASPDCDPGPSVPNGDVCGCGVCLSGQCIDGSATGAVMCPTPAEFCCIPSPEVAGFCELRTVACAFVP